jgi:hypothetical protein
VSALSTESQQLNRSLQSHIVNARGKPGDEGGGEPKIWRADCTFIIRKIKTFFAQLLNEIAQNQAIFESANFFGLAQNFSVVAQNFEL